MIEVKVRAALEMRESVRVVGADWCQQYMMAVMV